MSYSNINNLEEIRNKKVLFLDLETSGLMSATINANAPEERFPDYKNLENYDTSRIVSAGWLYMLNWDYDYEIGIENINEHIIKPENFIIPQSSINIHKITNEEANKNGKELNGVLKKIEKIIEDADYIVGYNIYFDISILLSEFYRKNRVSGINKILQLKKDKKIICLGIICSKEAKPVNYKPFRKYQMPKQSDVYAKCFNKELVNAHSAKYDVLGMIKIMEWIYENKL